MTGRPSSEVLVIVNPAAGGGRGGRRWRALADRLRSAGLDFDEALTSSPGDAERRARQEVRSSRRLIVAAGGDGTLNEVMNGFFEGGEPIPTGSALGVIPLGSGGDFRRTFGLPRAPDLIASLFRDGVPRSIDAGRVTFRGPGGATAVRHFINVADAGIGGEVVARVNRSSKPLGGTVAFLAASLAAIGAWRNVSMRVTAGGRTRELVAQQVVVANGRYFGSGMKVAPGAIPDDGLFDVLVVGDVNLRENLGGIRRIRSGRHLGRGDPKLELFRAARVEVDSAARVPLDLDGEHPGEVPALFEVVPGAVRLVAPPGLPA